MSDNAIIVCELSTTATDAPTLGRATERWLLAREIIAPKAQRDALSLTSAFLPGAKASEVAPGFADERGPAFVNQGVDIVIERTVHHAMENSESPRCPRCASSANQERISLIETWLEVSDALPMLDVYLGVEGVEQLQIPNEEAKGRFFSQLNAPPARIPVPAMWEQKSAGQSETSSQSTMCPTTRSF